MTNKELDDKALERLRSILIELQKDEGFFLRGETVISDNLVNGYSFKFCVKEYRKGSKRKTEIQQLRKILSCCASAIGNGSFASEKSSIEFLGMIPNEIQAEIVALKRRIENLKSVIAEYASKNIRIK